ncbi:hypothetical protein IGI04_015460, partial [Brassica rapa subsp. trilocularis]
PENKSISSSEQFLLELHEERNRSKPLDNLVIWKSRNDKLFRGIKRIIWKLLDKWNQNVIHGLRLIVQGWRYLRNDKINYLSKPDGKPLEGNFKIFGATNKKEECHRYMQSMRPDIDNTRTRSIVKIFNIVKGAIKIEE